MRRRIGRLVYVHPLSATIASTIRDLELIARVAEADDFRNRVEFLPL